LDNLKIIRTFATEIRNHKEIKNMRYTELGKTGMKISHLSFGASSLGSVFRETNEKESFEAVEVAIEGGINFIDVSPYYGHYKAETVLGKALRNIPRDKYFLSTKVGRYGKDGVNTWDYSARRVTDSVYESMERLGIDFIDLINVHDIEFQAALPGGLQLVVDETLPALVELREKGVVGHVGITDLQLKNLKWVIEHSEKGTVESILNFCHYTLNDNALEDYLGFFEEQGVGVINASPLSMGLLSQRGVPVWHPAPKPLVKACQKAAEYCSQKGYPIEKLAVQYSVSCERIASTLFSSANPANVKRNIEWANEEPDWELVREVKEIIGDQQRVTWANS
jgi:aryl-alcohol dehydrogenase-like predicted oxidoreductase